MFYLEQVTDFIWLNSVEISATPSCSI